MSLRSIVECNGCGLTVAMQDMHDYPQGWTSVMANARTCAPTIAELERKVERLKAV